VFVGRKGVEKVDYWVELKVALSVDWTVFSKVELKAYETAGLWVAMWDEKKAE